LKFGQGWSEANKVILKRLKSELEKEEDERALRQETSKKASRIS